MRLLGPREFDERKGVRSVVCCWSGGRDSTVSTHLTLQAIRDIDLDEVHVVYVDTTVTIPGHLEFVEETADRLGWPLTVLRPNPDFWQLARRKGSPTMLRRWCCYSLKIKPVIGFMLPLPVPKVHVLGLRWEEGRKRSRLPQYRLQLRRYSWGYCPIISWSRSKVLRYMERHNLPEAPYYRLGLGEACMCGAFSTLRELRVVRALFPNFFKKFLELEEGFERGGAAFYFSDRPWYAREIWAQKLLTDYLPE